ncbi:hypothetical protein [Nostoc sp. NMS9]|uniref:hypothetical protein n=1 Tax=Nostoc sp. NMS9 TaxID=2815393 RepID=UPI0025DB79E9|nr:hypothetical protein [Nostoc sp. NMS9]MBN3943904.1 hypothetical protein [Nostoc sp. NMS9]
MISEQELLTKWRSLPQDKQEEVLDFVEFIGLKNSANKIPLGERLQQIRTKIVAYGKFAKLGCSRINVVSIFD